MRLHMSSTQSQDHHLNRKVYVIKEKAMSTGKQTNQEGNGTGNIDASNARSNHLDQCTLFGIGSTARDIVLFSVAFHRSKYRLMDALARLCQCKLKYMEQQQYKRNVITSPDHNVEDVYDNMDEEKQLLDNGMEEKHHPLHPQHHHRKASSLVAFNERWLMNWKIISMIRCDDGQSQSQINHATVSSFIGQRPLNTEAVILPYLIDTAINQQATEIDTVCARGIKNSADNSINMCTRFNAETMKEMKRKRIRTAIYRILGV
eukprot:449693_1